MSYSESRYQSNAASSEPCTKSARHPLTLTDVSQLAALFLSLVDVEDDVQELRHELDTQSQLVALFLSLVDVEDDVQELRHELDTQSQLVALFLSLVDVEDDVQELRHEIDTQSQLVALFLSLVDVEDDVQELRHELDIVGEPLLEVHHHPRQQQRLLSQRGAGLVLRRGIEGRTLSINIPGFQQAVQFSQGARGEGVSAMPA